MPAPLERSVCSARVQPSTTGSTASRWLGFGASVIVTSPDDVFRVPVAERWYLTSPVPPSSLTTTASIVRSPSNSRRIDSYGRPTVCTSTFRRPRCAMPITTSWAPASAASSIASSSIGIIASSPSSENCFWPRNERRRYCSNPSARPSESSRRISLLGRERLAVAARLDRLPQPDALRMVGEVLDLVGHRAAVDRAEVRQRFLQRLARDVHPQQRRGNPLLKLGRQRRDQPRLVECRVAERLGAERVEARRQVPVHAVRLDERHRGCDAADQRLVDRGRCRGFGGGRRGSLSRRGGDRRGLAVRSVLALERLEQAEQARMRGDERAVAALEQLAPLGRHRVRVLEVVLEQEPGVPGVEPVDVVLAHRRCCT